MLFFLRACGVLLLLLSWSRPGLAQRRAAVNQGFGSEWALQDSMRALSRYARQRQPATGEQLSTQLLAIYPSDFTVAFAFPPGATRLVHDILTPRAEYHAVVYAYRAEFRRQRADYAGAEADLSRAIQYATKHYPYWDDDLRYAPDKVLLRHLYAERAALRRAHLGNRAGSCADWAASYELDPAPPDSLPGPGCARPRTHAPLNATQAALARLALTDSLKSAQRLLAAGRLDAAEQLLRQLALGRVGPYAWVRTRLVPVEPLNVPYLRSELARRRGQYAQARAYLDTLLAERHPQPLHRYALGTLKIDHLGDRAGGCADLRWAFEHNPDTASWHPDWRGCSMPRYQVPQGRDVDTYQHAYRDSLSRAAQLLAAGQAAAAERLLTPLIDTRQAGGFAAPSLPLAPLDITYRLLPIQLRQQARDTRARAYVALADYPRAVAELDTLILYFAYVPNVDYHCRRATLKADYLHDRAGSCADFAVCSYHRYWAGAEVPRGLRRWRGCDMRGQATYLDYREGVGRVGYFLQGRAQGVEVGYYLSPETTPGPQHGPGVGLEVGGQGRLLVAPKLAYEGYLNGIGGRVEAAYYLGSNGHGITGDLRLTPQAGISLGGVLNVFYGYSIPLTNSRLDGLGAHRLSIYLNFLDFLPPFKIGG